jgi:hypothetical protein
MPRQLQKIGTATLAGLCFLFSFLGDSAGAAPALSCAPAAALRSVVKGCESNSAYSDAARLCVEKYEAAIGAARVSLAQALAKFSSVEKQEKALENAKGAYQSAIGSLHSLVALGGKLKAEISGYENEVVLPEDFESVGESGFSPQVFLDNNPCYKSTQDLLAVYAELMGSRAQELGITAKIAESLAEKAFRGEIKLHSDDLLPMLGTPAAGGSPKEKSAPPGKSGTSRRDQSDITGTERKKDELPKK